MLAGWFLDRRGFECVFRIDPRIASVPGPVQFNHSVIHPVSVGRPFQITHKRTQSKVRARSAMNFLPVAGFDASLNTSIITTFRRTIRYTILETNQFTFLYQPIFSPYKNRE